MNYDVEFNEMIFKAEIYDEDDDYELDQLILGLLDDDISGAHWSAVDGAHVLPAGFITSTLLEKLENSKLNQIQTILEGKFGEHVQICLLDDYRKVRTYCTKLTDLLTTWAEEHDEILTISSCRLIQETITAFLNNGRWHYGVKSPSGRIYDHTSPWPDAALDQTSDQRNIHPEWAPIIWFGLPDAPPTQPWSLEISEFSTKQRTLRYLEHGQEKERTQQQWQVFWGEVFWTLDWPSLFDFDANSILTWMFAECGMGEPVEEFHRVIASCPVELNVSDTNEQFKRKLEDLILAHRTV